jgi:hypothetical protein
MIPVAATELRLRFEPAADWTPHGTWVRELQLDLRTGAVTTRT